MSENNDYYVIYSRKRESYWFWRKLLIAQHATSIFKHIGNWYRLLGKIVFILSGSNQGQKQDKMSKSNNDI
jgi:hypothetical protein